MAADVEECTQLAAAIPQNDERLAGDLANDVVAGLRESAHAADAIPVAREDSLGFLAQQLGRRIALARHGLRAAAVRGNGPLESRHRSELQKVVSSQVRESYPPARVDGFTDTTSALQS